MAVIPLYFTLSEIRFFPNQFEWNHLLFEETFDSMVNANWQRVLLDTLIAANGVRFHLLLWL